jgi:hypothetical protein
MNFTKTITELFLAQRIRLLASGVPIERLNAANDALESKQLDPDSIDKACCAELLLVLNKRYDVPEPMSTRLDKFGWSSANIKNHMESFLRSKLKSAQTILREHIEENKLVFNLNDLDCN